MNFLRYMLFPFAWLYGAITGLRNLAYSKGWLKVKRLEIPVISVGNLSAGGTGKTPTAEFLLKLLKNEGYRPAYLSRGYGRKTSGFLKVDPSLGDARTFGDEALQVAMKFPDLPVAVCEDRFLGGKRVLKEAGADVLVLDDAFQHRKLHRDFDLVVVDANRMPDKDFMIPVGRLREGRHNLRRADFLLINKVDQSDKIPALASRLEGHELAFAKPKFDAVCPFAGGENLSPEAIKGRKVIAFSGLGNNAQFQKQLENLGLEVVKFFPFPDHHRYSEAELGEIIAKYKEVSQISGKFGPPFVLTTEKDFARLQTPVTRKICKKAPFHYVTIKLKWWEGETKLIQKLKEIL